MKKLSVTVNNDHIKNGTASNGASCPIALALKASLPGVGRVSVGYYYVAVRDRDDKVIYFTQNISKEMRHFMEIFDAYKRGTPQTFEFTVMEASDILQTPENVPAHLIP